MKPNILLLFVLFSTFFSSQAVHLITVVKMNDNKETTFLPITKESADSEFLGLIEVKGFSNKDNEIFAKVYKKAKEIGANSYLLYSKESIEGTSESIDPAHYFLKLFYSKNEILENNRESLILFGNNHSSQKVKLNGEKILLGARAYHKTILEDGKEYLVSSSRLLGSTLKLVKRTAPYYYQIQSISLSSSSKNDGFLVLKSSDLVPLDPNFGAFLKLIYNGK